MRLSLTFSVPLENPAKLKIYSSYTSDMTEDFRLGDSMTSHLSMTQNLAEGLLPLQLHDKPRILWIDAICIYLGRY
jgi:hypothetical protein